MARPVTLFTGQWADLSFEDLAAKVGGWDFDGLELACWGDHFEVPKALSDSSYFAGRREVLERNGLNIWAIGAHLTGPGGVRPDRCASSRAAAPEVWGDGDPEGVRQRAAERMKDTARAAAQLGVEVVTGFTGSSIWHMLYSFPPNDFAEVERGYEDFARALGPDHRRLRRRGRAVRAGGPPHRDRLRLRDHAQDAGRDRPPRGLRHQLRSVALRAPVPRQRGVRHRVRGPDLPRARQGLDPARSTGARRSSAGT